VFRPIDGVRAGVGATVDDDAAIAEMPASRLQNKGGDGDFAKLVRQVVQDLKGDSETAAFRIGVMIEPVDDHGSMLGGVQSGTVTAAVWREGRETDYNGTPPALAPEETSRVFSR